MKSSLVRSQKFTYDLAPAVDTTGITFRGRLDVRHNAIAIHKSMSHAVVLVRAKTNNHSFIIYRRRATISTERADVSHHTVAIQKRVSINAVDVGITCGIPRIID